MLNILAPFFSKRKTQIESPNGQQNEQVVSIWQDTGKVYYLENTLKLSYESELGRVTYEDLNLDKLNKILLKLKNQDHLLHNQKTVANVTDALTISICAVTWQQKDDMTRIKAIPNAAILRSKTSSFMQSQAVFRHQHALEHDDILTTSQVNGKDGVFTYANVSVHQFIEQIESTNSQLTQNFKKQISVKQDNFKQAFTENEEKVIEQLISRKEPSSQLIKDKS